MSFILAMLIMYSGSLPKPSSLYHISVNFLFCVRKILLRYFMLPRPEFLRRKYIPAGPDIKTGRYNAVEYLSYPWYVKPTWKNRWGPRALVTFILGRRLPGDDGNRYAPEGYLFEEIGPDIFRAKGVDEMRSTEAALGRGRRGGCPFTLH